MSCDWQHVKYKFQNYFIFNDKLHGLNAPGGAFKDLTVFKTPIVTSQSGMVFHINGRTIRKILKKKLKKNVCLQKLFESEFLLPLHLTPPPGAVRSLNAPGGAVRAIYH